MSCAAVSDRVFLAGKVMWMMVLLKNHQEPRGAYLRCCLLATGCFRCKRRVRLLDALWGVFDDGW